MTELSQIVIATNTAHQQGQSALLATVVRVQGSSYRRPGARMLLTQEGWQAGCISGGCLESDIIRKAWWRTENGQCVVVTYDSTVDEESSSFDDPLSWGLGLGCNGIVEVMLERLRADDPACSVQFIEECLQARKFGVIATIIASEQPERLGQRVLWREGETSPSACTVTEPGLASRIGESVHSALAHQSPSQSIRVGDTDLFLEAIVPPTQLIICGANHDAAPLARLAKSVGWQVTVVDPWIGSPPRPERFPGADSVVCCSPSEIPSRVALEEGAFVVVMSHNLAHDAAFLAALLPSPVRYIGLLGPRKRTERLMNALREQGISCSFDDPRLHGPIGLDIGADDPEAISLSILAEMQAVKAQREGGFLRERPRPIHDGTTPIFPSSTVTAVTSRPISRRVPVTRKPENAL